MSEAIIVALITGGLSLVGVVVTCVVTARKNETALKISQAVTDTKIEELSRQMNKHNNLMERVFRIEGQIAECQHDIKDLKAYHKPTPAD
jgi:peptidoglycan hydrolase CwlO-like protein